MDNSELRQKWPDLRNKLLMLHPELTREELIYEIGKEEELLKTLQAKLKKNKKEIDYYLALLG